ncbi:hypothetical protein DL546_000384 [Coniochaeta pulveracea]|uniref:Uncharacterized protein n=1 Tax=Coniochaeta pulveracea TaxID=177199 RepID=A0A420Y1H0_9PEZI|nr:hypothetical protein DL546_000384 [Coniochaeta pulveracea]
MGTTVASTNSAAHYKEIPDSMQEAHIRRRHSGAISPQSPDLGRNWVVMGCDGGVVIQRGGAIESRWSHTISGEQTGYLRHLNIRRRTQRFLSCQPFIHQNTESQRLPSLDSNSKPQPTPVHSAAVTMKPATVIAALIPLALAAPTRVDNAPVEVDKRAYGSYGTYPAPSGGYGNYGAYPPPKGGYGNYGSYKRAMGDFVKKIFG